MSPEFMPLLDILTAIRRALQFTDRHDVTSFQADQMAMWAAYSQMIIIGEATNRISREFQQQHAEIPWAEMRGMRNKMVHNYDDVDWDLLWETVTGDLPRLKASIEPLIPKEP